MNTRVAESHEPTYNTCAVVRLNEAISDKVPHGQIDDPEVLVEVLERRGNGRSFALVPTS